MDVLRFTCNDSFVNPLLVQDVGKLQPEFALPYLVFLLAHREGFDGSAQQLKNMEGYRNRRGENATCATFGISLSHTHTHTRIHCSAGTLGSY